MTIKENLVNEFFNDVAPKQAFAAEGMILSKIALSKTSYFLGGIDVLAGFSVPRWSVVVL